jgi:hypothetical protein
VQAQVANLCHQASAWLGENPQARLLKNVEQAPSPALSRNSRGRLFSIFSSSVAAKVVHDHLALSFELLAFDFEL